MKRPGLFAVQPQRNSAMDDSPMDSRQQRTRLKQQHRQMFDELSALLFRHDPICLNFETNTDEYDPEAETILPRLLECHSEQGVLTVVHEEFNRWFADSAGSKERYTNIAAEIWERWGRTFD